eukprot:scaffold121_cov412-Prasinococcus_capsulatus_cf.AAC.6
MLVQARSEQGAGLGSAQAQRPIWPPSPPHALGTVHGGKKACALPQLALRKPRSCRLYARSELILTLAYI